MKLILENWNRFLNEQTEDNTNLKLLSVKEFDSLDANGQLDYYLKLLLKFNKEMSRQAKDAVLQKYNNDPEHYGRPYFKPSKYARKYYDPSRDFDNQDDPNLETNFKFDPKQLKPAFDKLLKSKEDPMPKGAQEDQQWLDQIFGTKGTGPAAAKKTGRSIKQEWAKRADRSFFDKFYYVHGSSTPEYIMPMLQGKVDSKSELSTRGYLKGTPITNPWADRGISFIVDGYVTLAGHLDLQTDFINRKKQGGENKFSLRKDNIYTNEESFKYDRDNKRNRSGSELARIDEALIDNWKITGIAIDPSQVAKDVIPLAKEASKKFNLPILDFNLKEIDVDKLSAD